MPRKYKYFYKLWGVEFASELCNATLKKKA